MPSHEQLMQELARLHTLKADFDHSRTTAVSSGKESDLAAAEKLGEELKQGLRELGEKLNPVEKEIGLKAQYESQVELWKNNGVLTELEHDKWGFVGIDGKKYFVPTCEDIAKRFAGTTQRKWKERRDSGNIVETDTTAKEYYRRKIEQGFNTLIIVPFGTPLDTLTDKYKTALQMHFNNNSSPDPNIKKRGLFRTTKDNAQPEEEDRITELNSEGPLWVWDQYRGADTNGTIAYEPRAFDQANHEGKTKQQILEEPQSFPGFRVLLLENLPNIPRKSKGKSVKNRPQLDTGGTGIEEYVKKDNDGKIKTPCPHEYLKALQNSPNYIGEQGMTPEDQIAYALYYLEKYNQVVDDYQGNGSLSYQIGAYFPASGGVPYSYWDHDVHQAYLGGSGPGNRGDRYGVRLAVGVK